MTEQPTDRRAAPGRRGFLLAAGAMGAAAALAPTLPGVAAVAKPGPKPEPKPKRPRPPLTTPWTSDVRRDRPHPEYPRPQLTRPRWKSLNGVWQFAGADARDTPPIGRDLDERIVVPYPVESALSGVMRHESRMFYRRHFEVPRGWRVGTGRRDERLLLHFDAVDYEATVWVNGHRLAQHRGGYDRFSVDVTRALRVDHHGRPAGEQEVVVEAADPTEDGVQPLGKQRVSAIAPGYEVLYYTPASGIWQSVWLEPVPAVGVERLELTPDPEHDALDVRVVTGAPVEVRVRVSAHGRTVASGTGRSNQSLRLRVKNPRLWTPDDPFLYDVSVETVDEHGTRDRVGSYAGMRSVRVGTIDGVPRILLNGEPVFQLSTLQQGFWPDGVYTPATDDAAIFDVAANKALGFNTIRKHVKVESDRWYYHADRLGQLVWQDMPSTATGSQPPDPSQPAPPPPADGQREFERELRRLVEQHRNHPSIVMWIPFNEGWGQYDVARIAETVKRWDPSRIVNAMSGADTAGNDSGAGDVLDLHNIGFTPPAPVPSTVDGRAAVIGEFGAYGLVTPGHVIPGKTASPAPVADVAELNDRYETIMAAVANYARNQGLSAANYNLFEDAEHQVNGLYTYDRRVLKPSAKRVRAANLAVIAAGSAPR